MAVGRSLLTSLNNNTQMVYLHTFTHWSIFFPYDLATSTHAEISSHIPYIQLSGLESGMESICSAGLVYPMGYELSLIWGTQIPPSLDYFTGATVKKISAVNGSLAAWSPPKKYK